jgi:hypothetical protein
VAQWNADPADERMGMPFRALKSSQAKVEYPAAWVVLCSGGGGFAVFVVGGFCCRSTLAGGCKCQPARKEHDPVTPTHPAISLAGRKLVCPSVLSGME